VAFHIATQHRNIVRYLLIDRRVGALVSTEVTGMVCGLRMRPLADAYLKFLESAD